MSNATDKMLELKMNDTQILDDLLVMLEANKDVDWHENDPVEEFNGMMSFIIANRNLGE